MQKGLGFRVFFLWEGGEGSLCTVLAAYSCKLRNQKVAEASVKHKTNADKSTFFMRT